MKKKYSARLKVSKSRKSKLGKTKPNFNKMVKDQCKRYEQFSEKKIGETKPNLDKLLLILSLRRLRKLMLNLIMKLNLKNINSREDLSERLI